MDEQHNPQHKPIAIYYANLSDSDWGKIDKESAAWVRQYLEAFLATDDLFEFSVPVLADLQLAELERLDAQVQGDECPQALEWIMNAHRKHEG